MHASEKSMRPHSFQTQGHKRINLSPLLENGHLGNLVNQDSFHSVWLSMQPLATERMAYRILATSPREQTLM